MTDFMARLFKKSPTILTDAFKAQQQLIEGNERPVIFDVGGYIGRIARRYRTLFPHADIYSFEPFPESFTQLQQAVAGTGIKIYPFAFSDTEGRTAFHVNTDRSCNSLFPRPEQGHKYYAERAENIREITVQTRRLDDFCKEHNISQIDILKLDVEGAEIKALEGGRQLLADCSVGLVYSEISFVRNYQGGCEYYQLCRYLDELDYRLYNLYHLKRARNGQIRWGDAIFLGPHLREKIESRTAP